MRICRFILEGEPAWGAVEGDAVLPLPLSPLGAPGGSALVQHGASLPLARVRLLPPTIPRKIIAVGLNYRPHILEMGLAEPAEPVIFLKASSSLAA